jgi:sortase A
MMRIASLVAGVALLVAGMLLVGYGILGQNEAEAPEVAFLPAPSIEEPTEEPTSSPEPTAEASKAPVTRLEVPSIGIDAPVVSLGVLNGGVMESPHTPVDVGWYRFSAQPGMTGNAVFAGHVDYARYGPAVFYHLRSLKNGDVINVILEDGTKYAYQVVSSVVYNAETAPVQEIVGPTENQTITLITCTGVFDRNVLEYDKRLVVRAERSTLALSQ